MTPTLPTNLRLAVKLSLSRIPIDELAYHEFSERQRQNYLPLLYAVSEAFNLDHLQLLLFLQAVECNAVSVSEHQLKQEKFCYRQVVRKSAGIALFRRVSKINHDCLPNAFLVFDSGFCEVRTLRHVPIGSEICITYGPEAFKHALSSRRDVLASKYGFVCRCASCTSYSLWLPCSFDRGANDIGDLVLPAIDRANTFSAGDRLPPC
jgi:hypothetical protein